MEPSESSSLKQTEERRVSDDLMQQLHEANEEFHKIKQSVEEATATTEYEHQQGIDHANQKLREAEQKVEEINQRIHAAMKPPPAT